MSFLNLGLSEPLRAAVDAAGYTEPTDIQRQAIPHILMGRDLVGVAQTGTGKTASFVLPMIDILSQGRARARMPRSLIIAPTRELADQVAENFLKYGKNHKLSMVLLIGGVGFGDQDKALEKGVDVLIATPGRLLDQFERGKILMSGVEILVIDEADRMLDMGFIPDVERICALLGKNRQTLLFSATMAPPIKKLADRFMSNPRQVEVSRPASTHANIDQALLDVAPRGKRSALKKLLSDDKVTSAIVFCNRKKDVKALADALKKDGFRAGQIHGDMEQRDRMATMAQFKSDEINVLIASDVAARGLDIKGVSHIFNYDVPFNAEDYVHRIGRTGRAGAKGIAVTLATPAEAELVEAVEALIGQPIPRSGQSAAAEERPKGEAPPRAADTQAREAKQPARRSEPSAAKPAPAPARKPSAEEANEPRADDADPVWNGPIPRFLKQAAA